MAEQHDTGVDDVEIPDYGADLEANPEIDEAKRDLSMAQRRLAGESGALRELYWWVRDKTVLGQFNLTRESLENEGVRYYVSAVEGNPAAIEITDLVHRTMAEMEMPEAALESRFAEWLK